MHRFFYGILLNCASITMNRKYFNVMKNVLLIIVGMSTLLCAYAQGPKNFIDQPYIEVTGTAKMQVIPDEIYISIEIDENDNKGKQAVEDLEKKMMSALGKVGVDVKKDLSIVDFSSNFKSYWYKKSGIRNNKKYQVVVNSGKMAGKVFLAMEEIGISNLSIVKTDHSKIEEYRQEVKVKAMKAARKKAGNLAEAIEQKAGKAIFIQERNVRPYSRAKMSNEVFMVKAQGADKEIADIDFEFIELEYEIFARFVLE